MTIVRVVHGEKSASILLDAGIALVAPKSRFHFFSLYIPAQGRLSFDHRDLATLPWASCTDLSIFDHARLSIVLTDDQGRTVFVTFTKKLVKRDPHNMFPKTQDPDVFDSKRRAMFGPKTPWKIAFRRFSDKTK